MKFSPCLPVLLLLAVARPLTAQVPQLVNYQGRIAVGSVNFHGSGQFKFTLVNAAGGTSYWSNDGSSTAGSEPAAAITLNVTKGLYSVMLGDTVLPNMTAIPAAVWNNADVRLRVWFNDGSNGFQLLTPDQRLAPNGYLPDSAVTSAKIAAGAVGGTQLADGSITAAKMKRTFDSGLSTAGAMGSTGVTFTGTFAQPFAAPPAVTLLNAPTAALGAVTTTGFSASVPFITATPDSTGNVGEFICLKVVNGNPAICYRDAGNLDLKYVRANDVRGISWGAPVTLDSAGEVGLHCTMAVVNGKPAVAYKDSTLNTLKFVRANDASGTVWGAPVLIPGTGGCFSTSLAVVNGNPAMSYFDQVSFNLKYIRASDAGGTSWPAPVLADADPSTGWDTSLAVVNGRPAIAYYDLNAGDLKYVRATDANGTAWSPRVLIDSANNVGTYPSLAVINGNPAIAYHDERYRTLKYARAADADGAAWDAGQTIDGAESVGLYPSLAEVNGYPVITHNDLLHRHLKCMQGADASGTNWQTPLTLDGTGTVVYYSSVAVVDGKFAVSYRDGTNGDVKYLRAPDLPQWQASDGTTAPLASAMASVAGTVVPGAIGNTQLAADAVQTSNIADGTIKAGDIDATSIGLWSVSGADVYRPGGKVGIGVVAPGAALHVAGSGFFGADSGPLPGGAGAGIRIFRDSATNAGHVYNYNYGTNTAGDLILQAPGGRVGIGTLTPACPLEVTDWAGLFSPGDLWVRYGSGNTTWVTEGANTANVSIRATQYVSASGFISTSDERMKRITGRSEGAADLLTLLDIEITNYHFKDTVAKGNTPQKKVIAQQVEKVFPQAVSKTTDVVPDIFRKAAVRDGWILLVTSLKKGDRVKLIGEKAAGVYEVREATAEKFRTAGLPEGSTEVFVYGREVNDFRAVDYEAIAMLNVSATQELARKLKAQEDENAALKRQIAAVAAEDQESETRLTKLEQLISTKPQSSAVTVKGDDHEIVKSDQP